MAWNWAWPVNQITPGVASSVTRLISTESPHPRNLGGDERSVPVPATVFAGCNTSSVIVASAPLEAPVAQGGDVVEVLAKAAARPFMEWSVAVCLGLRLWAGIEPDDRQYRLRSPHGDGRAVPVPLLAVDLLRPRPSLAHVEDDEVAGIGIAEIHVGGRLFEALLDGPGR